MLLSSLVLWFYSVKNEMMKRLKCWVFWLVALFLFVSFWYCDDIVRLSNIWRQSVSLNIGETMDFSPGFCLYWTNTNNWITVYYSDWTQATSSFISNDIYCFNVAWYIINNGSQQRNAYYYSWISVGSCSCSDCPTCPEINTGDILSWYILESEIDNLYCENHWYCPIIDTWSIESWNWSALFINDIQHVSAPLINITIPEEFDWNYTWNDEEFDLSISWYNVDTEYIDWIIRKQTTLPNSTDFNNTVSWLIPLFVPWLVIILLIYFIFRFIKKIF